MTVWGMDTPCIIQRMCGKSVFPVSSSRAKSLDLFRWRQDGECLRKRNGKHCIAEKAEGGASSKRLSEGGGKTGTKKISRCARNDSVGNGYPVHHTKKVWEKRSSRIVIPSEALGSFSLAARRRVSEKEKRETPLLRKGGRRCFS